MQARKVVEKPSLEPKNFEIFEKHRTITVKNPTQLPFPILFPTHFLFRSKIYKRNSYFTLLQPFHTTAVFKSQEKSSEIMHLENLKNKPFLIATFLMVLEPEIRLVLDADGATCRRTAAGTVPVEAEIFSRPQATIVSFFEATVAPLKSFTTAKFLRLWNAPAVGFWVTAIDEMRLAGPSVAWPRK